MAGIEHALLGDNAEPLMGSELTLDEALVAARKHSKWLPMCAVREWMILDMVVTDTERARVEAAGCKPMFLFAHQVIHDEQRRFEPGHWVRSSMGTTFREGFLFFTRNTIYVLMGPGHRTPATIDEIFSIF